MQIFWSGENNPPDGCSSGGKRVSAQPVLDFTPEEEQIIQLLSTRGDLHINTLVVETGLPINKMSALLFELEMKGVIRAYTGGTYHLLG